MVNVTQRPEWHGAPVELGELFAVRKGSRVARCALRSHQLGWELSLFVGHQTEVVQSAVCRSQETVIEYWRGLEGCDDRKGLGIRESGQPVVRSSAAANR